MAARAGFDPFSGGFIFTSYRDPNLLTTLDAYDGAAAFLNARHRRAGSASARSSASSATIDAYRLPDAKGLSR